uniref:Uncharacterized protein n=1 Tax=Rhizophora mucronata TaxID=61149 RepID=A0A2P2PBY7_RHIMU
MICNLSKGRTKKQKGGVGYSKMSCMITIYELKQGKLNVRRKKEQLEHG